MGMVGEDPFGHFLADTLAGAGVDIAPLRFTPDARTALAFVSLRADGEREFMFYRHPSADMLFTPDAVDTAAIDAAQALHFDSISLASENPRASSLFAADRARAAGHLVTYDVNLRLPLWPDAEAAKAGILAGLAKAPGGQAQRRRARVHDRQPRARGGAAALARRAASWSRSAAAAPARPGSPATGQNDVATHQGGGGRHHRRRRRLHGRADRRYPGRAGRHRRRRRGSTGSCRFANAVGALTTLERGAIPALPTRAAVESFLEGR